MRDMLVEQVALLTPVTRLWRNGRLGYHDFVGCNRFEVSDCELRRRVFARVRPPCSVKFLWDWLRGQMRIIAGVAVGWRMGISGGQGAARRGY